MLRKWLLLGPKIGLFQAFFRANKRKQEWVGVVSAFLLHKNDIFNEIEVWNLKVGMFRGVSLQKS